MKKLIALLLIAAVFTFGGCGKKQDKQPQTTPKTNTQQTQHDEKKDAKDTFREMMQTDTRPIAVMIDNDGKSSRPQIGLESAYMVYEVIVEGGASRLMALFKDVSVSKVGPVRSSRHYFLDYALEHDAIYCHAGWSPKAASDIRSLGVNNVNGVAGDGGVFYRDKTYDSTWHNLYTGVDSLYDYAVNSRGYRGTTDAKHLTYHDKDADITDGSDALEISLPYSTYYRVSYTYDADQKLYKRYVDGTEHMSQTGECLTAKNIIIMPVRNYNLQDGENKGRQEVNTVGSGSGKYITNGKAIDITWSKASRSAKTTYSDLSGNELILNPGNTYVQVVPLGSSVTVK